MFWDGLRLPGEKELNARFSVNDVVFQDVVDHSTHLLRCPLICKCTLLSFLQKLPLVFDFVVLQCQHYASGKETQNCEE